jgi:hypothetical protein
MATVKMSLTRDSYIQVIQPGSLFLSKGVFNVQSLLVHCTPDKADKLKIIIDYLG